MERVILVSVCLKSETFNEESETATKEEGIKKGGTSGKEGSEGSGRKVWIVA